MYTCEAHSERRARRRELDAVHRATRSVHGREPFAGPPVPEVGAPVVPTRDEPLPIRRDICRHHRARLRQVRDCRSAGPDRPRADVTAAPAGDHCPPDDIEQRRLAVQFEQFARCQCGPKAPIQHALIEAHRYDPVRPVEHRRVHAFRVSPGEGQRLRIEPPNPQIDVSLGARGQQKCAVWTERAGRDLPVVLQRDGARAGRDVPDRGLTGSIGIAQRQQPPAIGREGKRVHIM